VIDVFQLLFAEHIGGLPLLQLDVVVLTALAFFKYSTKCLGSVVNKIELKLHTVFTAREIRD
jgi:hypothetical protein